MVSRRAKTDRARVSSASLVRSTPIVEASPGPGTAAAARRGSCGMNQVNANAASDTPAAVRKTAPNAPVKAVRNALRRPGGRGHARPPQAAHLGGHGRRKITSEVGRQPVGEARAEHGHPDGSADGAEED